MNPYPKNTKIFNLFEKIKDNNRNGPLQLHHFVIQGNEFMNEYIDEYLNLYPNQVDNEDSIGKTALMIACQYARKLSSIETIKILLSHKADVNIRTIQGSTALMFATMNSNMHSFDEIIELLLEHHADVNIQNNYGITSLMFACMEIERNSTARSIQILVKHGADVNIRDDYGYTSLDYYLAYVPLHYPLDTLKMLIKSNIRIDSQTIKIATQRKDRESVLTILLPTRKMVIEWKKILSNIRFKPVDYKFKIEPIENYTSLLLLM